MTWRVARSLETLLTEINAAAPNRSKVSDGSIGDPAHSSRVSDHNPNALGVVRARDFTHDPANGLDCNVLAERLAELLGKHPALRSGAYLIWRGRIVSANRIAEDWRPYTGSNPHDKHCHVSVTTSAAGYDSTEPWGVMTVPKPPEPAKPTPLVEKPRTRVAAVNMHAPGADDDLRMEHAIDRFNHLDFTVVALSEFNLPMARKLREYPKWGLHRAVPNSGTSGNAVAFWKPVWKRVAVEDIDVMTTSRVLHMAGLVLEHRRTGFVLPVLAIHNPTSTKNVHVPQSDRDLCIEAERRWPRRMTSAHGRAVVLGDFNQRGALEGTSLSRAVSHNVDEVYGRGALIFSKPQVHEGFNPAITDHAAVSVLINVTT